MSKRRVVCAVAAVLLSFGTAGAASTPALRCQAGKNHEAGKYALCRQDAEKRLLLTGDAAYSEAVTRCETKFASKWQRLIDTATSRGATCPDASLTQAQFKAVIDAHSDNIGTALGGGGLSDCSDDLTTCNADLSTCNTSLTSTQASLAACTGDLNTCNSDLATCQTTLGTCGNGVRDGVESCDGSDLGGVTCTSLGFLGGGLACNSACKFDMGGCLTTLCGNGVIDAPEQCDSSDLGGQTCAGLSYGLGGTLRCTVGCGLDSSGCTGQAFPETGQTTCWDASGAVFACAGTGYDGDIQAGAPLAYFDNGDGTITDLNTHLMWEKKSVDGSIHQMSNTYDWTTAFSVFLAGLNSGSGFAGYTDWRLPNSKELQSIISYEAFDPAVSPDFNNRWCWLGGTCTVTEPCSCTFSGFYWSSTTYRNFPDDAWGVTFTNGVVQTAGKSWVGAHVRAVRGASNSAPRFVDNGNGTVSDYATGLMWEKKSDDGSIHDKDNEYWQVLADEQLAPLNAAAFAGYNDWRLPSITELQTLVERSNNPLAINAAFTENCVPGCTVTTCSCTGGPIHSYWSSSTPAGYNDVAYWITFYGGGFTELYPSDRLGLVRAVRTARGWGSAHSSMTRGSR